MDDAHRQPNENEATIGPLRARSRVLLAPMAGYTDAAFRSLCLEHGCGLAFTEMTNARGVVRGDPRTLNFLLTAPDESPVGAHLYGRDPDTLAEAARHAEATGRFTFIDLNAGCPVPKIMSRGDGAGMLRDIDNMARVVRALKKAVSLPVSVKTRLGIQPGCPILEENALRIEDAGADILIVHARYAKVRHAGPADWQALAALKKTLSIPLVGNGGIAEPSDVERMLRETGADAAMIGRAAIGNPWFFSRAAELAGTGRDPGLPPAQAIRATIAEHLRRLRVLLENESRSRRQWRYPAEEAACCRFRAHIVRYLRGFRGLREMARQFDRLVTIDAMTEAADQVLAGGRSP